MQWLTLPAIIFAEVYAQHASGKSLLHRGPLSLCCIATWLRGSLLTVVERLIGVLDDVDVRKDNEAFLDHLIDERQEGTELFGGVDGREHDGTMMGREQRLVFVQTVVCAVAENTSINGNAGDVVGSHGFNQGFIERLILP